MATRKPIPIPAKLRWREFRLRFLPILTLGSTALAVLSLWMTQVRSPTLVAEAIGDKASIFTPISGTVATLNVETFQSVAQGETVAVINPMGIKNQLSSLRLEMSLIQDRIEPLTDQKRDSVSYYRLRLEWLQQRVSLASSRVNLQRAQNELTRDQNLFNQQVISPDQLDQTQKTVAALEAEVSEASDMVSELGTALEELEAMDKNSDVEALNAQLEAALAEQEKQLRELEQFSKPFPLVAPIAGQVAVIDRLPGENVMSGDRILAITATDSTRLIAYARHPLNPDLRAGKQVTLQTRGKDRLEATTTIQAIGPEWQSLNRASQPFGGSGSSERGLPILMTLPPELQLRPGEMVDVFLNKG